MLGILGISLWTLLDPKAKDVPKVLLLIAGFLLLSPFLDQIMELESVRFPLKYDYHLYRLDLALGITAFSIARWFSEPSLPLLLAVYRSLTLAMIGWYAVHLRRREGTAGLLLTAYLIMYASGPLLYMIVPGRGPRHAFPDAFPMGHPMVPPVLVKLEGWPNAMPSLHVATALLLALFAGKSKIAQYFAWTYLAGTVAATMALEHYFIDLVVAIPFSCFAVALAERRFRAASGFLSLVLGWLCAIRLFTPVLLGTPFLTPCAALATVVVCAFWMHRRSSTMPAVTHNLAAHDPAGRDSAVLYTPCHSPASELYTTGNIPAVTSGAAESQTIE